jgi:uncharacterized protein YjbI with pentapeptide repeats
MPEVGICLACGVPTVADAPREPQLPFGLDAGEIAGLAHDARVAEIELADASLAEQHANGVSFQTVKLDRVDLSGSRLETLRIVDGVLVGCNLANLYARSVSLERARIENSRLTGIELTEGALRDVTFRGCRIDLASFGFSRLERVTFEDCLLSQTDFLEAKLDSVRFHACELSRADFRDARLSRCELRRSDLTDVQGVKDLRGAAMEWPDIVNMAGLWAATLGIEVLDTD